MNGNILCLSKDFTSNVYRLLCINSYESLEYFETVKNEWFQYVDTLCKFSLSYECKQTMFMNIVKLYPRNYSFNISIGISNVNKTEGSYEVFW